MSWMLQKETINLTEFVLQKNQTSKRVQVHFCLVVRILILRGFYQWITTNIDKTTDEHWYSQNMFLIYYLPYFMVTYEGQSDYSMS